MGSVTLVGNNGLAESISAASMTGLVFIIVGFVIMVTI
jgi:hypothetical protein